MTHLSLRSTFIVSTSFLFFLEPTASGFFPVTSQKQLYQNHQRRLWLCQIQWSSLNLHLTWLFSSIWIQVFAPSSLKNTFLYLASGTHFSPNRSPCSLTASSQYVFAGSFPCPSPHWRAQSLLFSFRLIPLVIPPGFMALNTTSRF